MNYRNLSFRGLIAFITLQFFFGVTVYAQTTIQTWVSGFGSDAGSCSFAAPCKTLAFALTKTTAGGEISIDSPGELGIVTINKAITINAVGALGSILAQTGANGVTVAAGATDVVVLRGLTINGAGVGNNGIYFTSGSRLHVENCTITGFTGVGLWFLPSATSALFGNNVSVKSNANGGIIVQPTGTGIATASLNGIKAEGNLRGIIATDGSTVLVRNSIVSGSTAGAGFAANNIASGVTDFTIENSVASGNIVPAGAYQGGIQSYGANATMRISNVTVTRNSNGLAPVNGGKIISFGNNRVYGNINPEVPPTQTLSGVNINPI